MPKGQICGVIGASGAGKSTLIRCVNLLERPTHGAVLIDDVDLTQLSEAELVKTRRQIGMIFQHFNLLTSRTVFENVALPLELENKSKAEIQEKTTALLPQDVQATLAEFTVQSIVLALNNIQTTLPCRLLVCGGGAKNQAIMNGLKQALPNWRIQLTTELDLDIDYVEAAAFAWLAYRRMHNLPANLPSVTGATNK